jgi:hypothetical protein
MSLTLIHFNGYKNLLHNGDLKAHDGKYALNIKSYVTPMYLKEEEIELAYDNCLSSFMDMADMTVSVYGFSGFLTEGRSGGWLKPTNRFGSNRPITANFDDYIPFEDYIIQEHIWSCFQVINKTKKDIERVYKHSQDLKEVNELLKEMMEGK